MNLRKILRDNSRALLESARRFPLTLALGAGGALMGAYVTFFQAHVWKDAQVAFLLACWACVPLSFAFGLLAEARRFGPRGRLACALIPLAASALAWWTLTPLREDGRALRFLLWFAAGAAAAAATPLLAGQGTARFRHFNLVLLQRLLATVALSLPLFLGLSLALWAVRTLFDIDALAGLTPGLWFLVTGLFGIAYFTGDAPRLRDDAVAEHPAFLRALTRFILLPLSLTYLVILYAYVARILLLREWPQGMVSGLILAFAATGIATHLLLQDNPAGGRWGRWYSRGFYLALSPLVAMLFAAIWRRHSEYGLTEERALVWVGAFWLAGLCAYFLARRNARVEAVPLTLGIVAFAISVGPWSVFEASRRSQTDRLQEQLIAAGRWHDGRPVRSAKTPDRKAEQEVSQILDYLNRRGELQTLRPWFSDDACAGCVAFRDSLPAPDSLVTALGLEWAPHRDHGGRGKDAEKFLSARDEVLDVRGYAFAVPAQANRWGEQAPRLASVFARDRVDAYRVSGDSTDRVYLTSGSDTLTSVDLSAWARGLQRDSLSRSSRLPPEALRIDWSDARGRYSLRVHEVQLAPAESSRVVLSLRGTLLLDPAR